MAGISTAGFVTFWFTVAYQELSKAAQNVENAQRQLRLHSELYPTVWQGPNEAAAKNSLATAQMIYQEVVKNYECTRRKPLNRIPAFVLGFREIEQE